jgi:hypothetical protein
MTTTIRVQPWALSAYRVSLLQALYAYHYQDVVDLDARGRGCSQAALGESCGGTLAKGKGGGWLLTCPGYMVVLAAGGVGPLADAGFIMPTK